MKELDDWVTALATELDLDPDAIDVEAVLDLAGDAAHHVVRPAAPVTTFVAGYLLGLSAGRGDADAPDSDAVLDRIAAFARTWGPAES
jgi:hypothetical protein